MKTLAIIALFITGVAQAQDVVIDQWWNIDYAKGAVRLDCVSKHETNWQVCDHPGNQDYIDSAVKDIQLRIVTEITASPACDGVRVLDLGAVSKLIELHKRYWTLFLDVVNINDKSQPWQILMQNPAGSKPDVFTFKGDDVPSKIAAKVCHIIKRKEFN